MAKITKMGVLTSGGDSPGMNCAIRAVVKACFKSGIEPYLIYNGYYGLVHDQIKKATSVQMGDIVNRGGTFIGSSRLPEFKNLEVRQIGVDNLRKHGIQALVVIGGDGSYMGMQRLSEMGIKCIGLPGTIDNNIASTEETIGFDTCQNTIINAIDNLRDTSSSHHRCMVVEVFGQYCGDLAVTSGLASGADIIIAPNHRLEDEAVFAKVKKRMADGKSHTIIVISENILNIFEYAKIIEKNTGVVTRAVQLGQVQRGGKPTARDRLLATKMGVYAVDLLKQDIEGVCVGLINNKITHTPVEVALKMPENGQAETFEYSLKLQ